jgi:U3 small nucleolar RNA-associated protein 18
MPVDGSGRPRAASKSRLASRAKRTQDARPADAEELDLAAELFGGSAGDCAGESWLDAGEDGEEGSAPNDFGIRDLIGSYGQDRGPGDAAAEPGRPKRAWVDEDDEDQVVDLTAVNRLRKLRKSEQETEISGADFEKRLREQHKKLHPGVAWAEAKPSRSKRSAAARRFADSESDAEDYSSGEDNDAQEEEVFAAVTRRAGGSLTVAGRPRLLRADELAVKRMADANVAARSDCVVQSMSFHRNGQLFLTAGFDQTARFFSIDGEQNPLMQQVHLKGMPIHTAAFTADGKSVIMSGRRKYYYVYDLQRASVQRVPGIVGREEKSFEKFALSPDNQWIAFLGDAGYIILVSNQCVPQPPISFCVGNRHSRRGR